MHQKSYINDAINCFGMENSNIADTPFDSHIRLCKAVKMNLRTGVSSNTTQGGSNVDSSAIDVHQK